MLQGHDPPNRTLKLQSPNGPSRSLVDLALAAMAPTRYLAAAAVEVERGRRGCVGGWVAGGRNPNRNGVNGRLWSQWSDDRRRWDPGLRVWLCMGAVKGGCGASWCADMRWDVLWMIQTNGNLSAVQCTCNTWYETRAPQHDKSDRVTRHGAHHIERKRM